MLAADGKQSVMARDSIDQLARRLAESLPQGMKALRTDIEQNFRSILDSGLARLDLVTREEFDVQEAVLARTRAKLDALEKRLADLESAGAPKTAAKKKTARAKTAKKSAKKSSRKKSAKRKKRPTTKD